MYKPFYVASPPDIVIVGRGAYSNTAVIPEPPPVATDVAVPAVVIVKLLSSTRVITNDALSCGAVIPPTATAPRNPTPSPVTAP
jgi:hypothetical protein